MKIPYDAPTDPEDEIDGLLTDIRCSRQAIIAIDDLNADYDNLPQNIINAAMKRVGKIEELFEEVRKRRSLTKKGNLCRQGLANVVACAGCGRSPHYFLHDVSTMRRAIIPRS